MSDEIAELRAEPSRLRARLDAVERTRGRDASAPPSTSRRDAFRMAAGAAAGTVIGSVAGGMPGGRAR